MRKQPEHCQEFLRSCILNGDTLRIVELVLMMSSFEVSLIIVKNCTTVVAELVQS